MKNLPNNLPNNRPSKFSDTPLPDCSPFEDQALALIEIGLSPIPIPPGEMKPAIDEWQIFADEMPWEAEILWWKTFHPDAGVGIPLGKSLGYSKGSYIVAINIDRGRYVKPVEALLFGDDTTEEPVYVAKRGSKGGTIFAISNERLETRRFSDDIGLAIELLSKGAQTVLPPSIHPDGMPYKWISDETLLTADLRKLPIITNEIVQALEALVKRRKIANENTPPESPTTYHGDGRYLRRNSTPMNVVEHGSAEPVLKNDSPVAEQLSVSRSRVRREEDG